ncbi:MAG: radical SAM protein [Candidatus Aenigmarchaeota archaeon]|nr:radical SAM protein [Candidatus Aenigmarchaeota archaeon]
MANILICDLPWKGKKYAGRTGMRWAHTSNKEPVVSFRPFPFYLATTAAVLENGGHRVMILDALAERLDDETFFKRAVDFQPDFILAEVHTPSYNNDRFYFAELKKATGAKNIFVGPHPTAMPEQVIKENPGVADFVVISEYDFLALDIAEGRVGEGIVKQHEVTDINKIPWPARHLFKMNLYNEVFCREYPNIQLMGSRGCPFMCTYCNVFTMNNFTRKQRTREPKDIWDEAEFVVAKHKPKELYFDDDIINATPKWFDAFLQEKIDRGIDIPFTCMGHVNISEQLLEKMKQANCVGWKLGIESTDDNVLRTLRKGTNHAIQMRTLGKCKELGIKCHLNFCIGLPGDTEETVKKTLEFAESWGDHYQVSIAAPLPGTELFEAALKNSWIQEINWDEFDGMEDAIIQYPHLPIDTLKKLAMRGQSNTYKKTLLTGEWKKYVKMIYNERGVTGVAKLVFIRGPGITKEILFSRSAD